MRYFIVNLRGFFLDNTSDFEVRIKELLNLAWTKLPESRDRMNKAMIDSLDNIEKFTSKNLGKIRKNDPLYECANNHKYALTIRNRVKILSEIIDILVNEKGLPSCLPARATSSTIARKKRQPPSFASRKCVSR